jgi:hypothetical protein
MGVLQAFKMQDFERLFKHAFEFSPSRISFLGGFLIHGLLVAEPFFCVGGSPKERGKNEKS